MRKSNFFGVAFLSLVVVFYTTLSSSQSIPKYGLVFGRDIKVEDAKYEINYFNGTKVDKRVLRYKNKAVIFLRDGKFREVLLFNTEQEAKNARKVVEPYLNEQDRNRRLFLPNGRGSFVVNLNQFCPDWLVKKTMKNNYPDLPYFECSR
jgi:hypothetical protein